MTAFLNSLRSETTKVLSVRSTLIYAVLLTGSLFGPVTLVMWFSAESDPVASWSTLNSGAMIFQLIAIVFAAATTAGDIRNHMHAQAFLTQRSRSLWVLSKVIVTTVFTTVLYLLGVGLAMLSAILFGGGLDLVGSEVANLTANLFASVAFAAMTVGLACVVRSQVGAVALPIAWLMVIDGMVGSFAQTYDWLRPIAAVSPGQRQMQLVYGEDVYGLDLNISAVMCVVIILGWFVALTAGGLWRDRRADVR